MSSTAAPADKLKDLLWNIQIGPDPELKYSLADYWADKGKQEEFISGTLPDGANWTTNLVLSHYKNYFPWEWVQGKFGIGPSKGFGALLASQSIITVPAVLLLLLGLATVVGLGYLLCCKIGGLIKKADLKKHKQHYKWITGSITVLGAIFLLCSALLFLQSATPVISSGLPTFARITSFILHDLRVYRKLLILEINYFFDVYIAANFKHLFNLPHVVEQMKTLLRLNQYRTVQDVALSPMSASALSLSNLRGSVFTAMHTTILIGQNVTDEIALLNAWLTQLARSCQGQGLPGCRPSNDNITIFLPAVNMVKNSLSNIDNAFLNIDFTDIANLFSSVDESFTAYIGRGNISRSIDSLAKTVKSEAVKGKRQYALAEGLPLPRDFTTGPAKFWQRMNEIQQKYSSAVYALCLAMTLLLAAYAIVTLLMMVTCALGTRGGKFPCYRRTSTATTSASIMLTINHVVFGAILPVTALAALTLIGGTLATVLAEAVNSRAIFDKLIDVTPYISHTLVVGGLTIDIDSFKRPLSICERTNPGILFALEVPLPDVVMAPVDKSLLNQQDTKNYLNRSLNSLADHLHSKIMSPTIGVFQRASLPTSLATAGVMINGSESLLYNSSLNYVKVAKNFKKLMASEPDPLRQANLQSLSSDYTQIASRLSWLNEQVKELDQNIRPINTDLSTMSSHYTVLKDGFTDLRTNAMNAVNTLRNRSMVQRLYEVLTDRLTLVSDNYLKRSLNVFKVSLGRCGHLAFTYTVINEVCFFTATRYANVLWFTLVIVSVSMAFTSFSSVHMFKYFGAYQDIDYTTDEERIKLSAKESELPLSKRRRTVRGTLADIFSGLTGRRKKKKRSKKMNVTRTSTILSLNEEIESIVFKSEDDLHLRLCTWDEIAKASLSFQFSDLDGPLIRPDPDDPPYPSSALHISPDISSSNRTHDKLKHWKAGKVASQAKNTNTAHQKLKYKGGAKNKEKAGFSRRKGEDTAIIRTAGVVSPHDIHLYSTANAVEEYAASLPRSDLEDYQPLTPTVVEEPELESEEDSLGRYVSIKGSRESFVRKISPAKTEELFGNLVQLKGSTPALAAGYGMESFNTIAASRPSDIGAPVSQKNLDVLEEERRDSPRSKVGKKSSRKKHQK